MCAWLGALGETFALLFRASLLAVPPVVLLDGSRTALSPFKSKLGEALCHVLFLGLLFAGAQQSFDPADRFAFRTRVLDMVLDEYKLEGLYPGRLHLERLLS